VPHAPLDPSAEPEAALVARDPAAAGLRRVWSDQDATIFAVDRPEPLVTGLASQPAASVIALDRSSLTIRAPAPGPYLLRVRYTPYWTAGGGVCVQSAGDSGLTRIDLSRAESVRLRFAPSVDAIADEILGRATGCGGS
jgi:hypothetical protein